jgi:hypothetical protein
MDKVDFLYVRSKYRGKFSPELLVFNANLQEFAQKVNYICALQTNGKLSAQKAFENIKNLWQQLETSQQELGIEKEK